MPTKSSTADVAAPRVLLRGSVLLGISALLLAWGCSSSGEPSPSSTGSASGGAPGGSGSAPSASGGENASGDGGSLGSGGQPSTTTGGSGNTGGTPAMGSGGEDGLDRSYAHGLVPTGITDTELNAAWQYWKDNYVELCGDNSARVIWDEPSQTVSEGIAYGMLGAVGNDDRDLFDRFWTYYQANLDSNGLMHWKRGGCEGSQPDGNSDNAATDAELDAAMALIQAECRFEDAGYGQAADDLIGRIFEHETTMSSLDGSNLRLLRPGDTFGGSDCLNPSYFAPAYYRIFAQRPAQAARKDAWNQLADDSYTLLLRFAHPQTGLVHNWVDEAGNSSEAGPSGCSWYDEADIYGADANRTPWRIATDYLWFGTAEAKTFLDPITDFVKGIGITEVGRKYALDGTPAGTHHHSIMSIGAFANGAMSYDQAILDEFSAEALTVDDHDYFPDSLRVLYLLLLSGRFTPCAGAHLPGPVLN